MFGQDRDQLRGFFQTCWSKRRNGEPLQPLERIVADVIERHPEYRGIIEDPEQVDRDFSAADGETNPWLHMGMHITIAEQLGADRPSGIRDAYRRIAESHGDSHAAEHAIMECLGVTLWEAQRAGRAPDEQRYLTCLKKLAH